MPRVGFEALRKAQVIQAVRKCVAESGLCVETARQVADELGATPAQVAIAQQGYSDPFLSGGEAAREGRA